MEHDFLDLDEYVAEASKTEKDRLKERPLMPWQEAELQMGSWAMRIAGLLEGRNPLTWSVEVFYIYAEQDYIALAAMQGGSTEEMLAEAKQVYEGNVRRGRVYGPDYMSGKLADFPADELLPISEDQAQEVMFYEFKLPIIFGMTDWFEQLIDHALDEFTVHGVAGVGEIIVCPNCGDNNSVRVIASISGSGGYKPLKTETGYVLIAHEHLKTEAVTHAHLVCMHEECEFNQCIDLNEFEIVHDGV